MIKFFKPKFWDKKESIFLPLIFLPLTLILQVFNLLKKKFISEKKFNIPIICVGNIYVGGTGKTPLSAKISEILFQNYNLKTLIVKKFHKQHFDEIKMLNENSLNVISKVSRADGISEAIEKNYDVVVLDDGFHDLSIKKNLNILCFNSDQLIGNGFTLPSGPLRESLKSIKRSKIIIINGSKNNEFELKIKKISNKINIYYSKYIPINSSKFEKKKYLAFAGIGNPENFFKLLKNSNIKIIKELHFPDHHSYSKKDINQLKEIAENNDLELITTEKDFHRLQEEYKININFLKIDLKIFDEKKFFKDVSEYI